MEMEGRRSSWERAGASDDKGEAHSRQRGGFVGNRGGKS